MDTETRTAVMTLALIRERLKYYIQTIQDPFLEYDTTVYPKVSVLAAWSEKCKWYTALPLGAVVSLFCESV
jgi:hypothetical protein